MLSAIMSTLASHLWQSTAFALMAGLFTLALKKNQARVRYLIWLTASIKFLIPFSLLMNIGSHFSWRDARVMPAVSVVSTFAFEQVAQSFTPDQVRETTSAGATKFFAGLSAALPVLVLSTLSVGVFVVLFRWWIKWKGVRAVVKHSVLLKRGRECEVLRRLEQ